ncbi:MAG: hypothetical protein P4M08_01325 [Oligoflexia bacterium]|nr:hypothetical protein [Oligoflexia bacterium]
MSEYRINCTGDVVKGDIIQFKETVFERHNGLIQDVGERTIQAQVLSDSYGSKKQQHTFTLEVIGSYGKEPLAAGKKIHRKGRNIYRHGTWRQAWSDEAQRKLALDEKHTRGEKARFDRAARKSKPTLPAGFRSLFSKEKIKEWLK